jgi:hypothetical protein
MKCDTGESYKNVPRHFNFHLDWTISAATLYEGLRAFAQLNSLNIYRRENRF